MKRKDFRIPEGQSVEKDSRVERKTIVESWERNFD
jgi:hypothetical protein